MTTPLVSVPVITYNSAKTIIETLESIQAQTYPNIELIVSDDYSADNTVEVCNEWIEQHKERFVRTQIITAATNTGTSANMNRAEGACRGEWIKPIAGDDLLMPNCIQDCLGFVAEHPETMFLFGKHKSFGASEKRCKEIDAVFDYSFFDLTSEQQLHRLIFKGNCVPATTVFYHRMRAKDTGVTNDERVPLLEDWPKWINLLRAGVKFYFIDQVLVKYRVGGISTNKHASLKAYISSRLFCFYYQYPEWYKEDPDEAVKRIVNEESEIYRMLLEAESEDAAIIHQERNQYKALHERYYKKYNQIVNSKAYRIGKYILKPFLRIRRNEK